MVHERAHEIDVAHCFFLPGASYSPISISLSFSFSLFFLHHSSRSAASISSYATGATQYVDPIWTLACERADAAGALLADTLLERKHGNRPVGLV